MYCYIKKKFRTFGFQTPETNELLFNSSFSLYTVVITITINVIASMTKKGKKKIRILFVKRQVISRNLERRQDHTA